MGQSDLGARENRGGPARPRRARESWWTRPTSARARIVMGQSDLGARDRVKSARPRRARPCQVNPTSARARIVMGQPDLGARENRDGSARPRRAHES